MASTGSTSTTCSESSEYVCSLQVARRSAKGKLLREIRAACAKEHGVDETNLYPLHVTVTGFFTATEEQAQSVACEFQKLAAELAAESGKSLTASIEGALAPDNGHVILDIAAPEFAIIAKELAARAERFGVALRPKEVRHMSLASKRNAEPQAAILSKYREQLSSLCGKLPVEFVVARREHKADVTELMETGTGHRFVDVLRQQLSSSTELSCAGSEPRPVCIRTGSGLDARPPRCAGGRARGRGPFRRGLRVFVPSAARLCSPRTAHL